MITLPHIAQPTSVEKTGAPEGQVTDAEGIAKDFLQLVRAAKAGLATQIDSANVRKVAIKNDNLKQAIEFALEKTTTEPQETLAALLSPQGKSTAAVKALFSASDKIDPEAADPDSQAINALFAMLPHQERQPVQTFSPQSPDKSTGPNKVSGLNITAHSHPTAAQSTDVESGDPRPIGIENSVSRFATAENQVKPAMVDNQTTLSPAISSSSPIMSAGTALATPTTPILNAQLGSQEWQQQLSQQVILLTRQGQQQAELRLHPEHLGKVEISLKLDDNQLQLQIMSPHSHVRAAIEAALPTLRTSLNESGLQLSQSQVGGEGSMQQQADQRQQHAARQNGTFSLDTPDDNDTALVPSEALQRLAQNQGAVDTFA